MNKRVRQMFYINQDEEITTIIGRMRRTQERVLFLVVPPRALITASLINMKLLHREGEKLGKNIVLVAQDEQGMAMAKKAGIQVEEYAEKTINSEETDFIEDGTVSPLAHASVVRTAPLQLAPISAQAPQTLQAPQQTLLVGAQQASLKSVDSMGGLKSVQSGRITKITTADIPRKSPIVQKKIQTAPISLPGSKEHDRLRDSVLQVVKRNTDKTEFSSGDQRGRFFEKLVSSPFPLGTNSGGGKKMREIDDLRESIPVTSGVKRAIWGFFVLGVILFAGACSYIFLPKADITAYVKKVTNESDFEFDAKFDGSGEGLRLALFDNVYDIKETFPATGKKTGSGGQKATGKVKIYNKFSDQPQPLVATTRLLASNGKLFRLLKPVTIPGMQGATPGVVEAEVRADEAGESYNIDSENFFIPGFDGTPKEGKFSAQSNGAFVGGGSTSGGQQSFVTAQDIEKAQKALSEKLMLQSESEAKQGPLVGMTIIPDAISFDVLDSSALPELDSLATVFEYSLRAKIRIIGFSEESIRQNIIQKMKSQLATQGKGDFNLGDLKIEYGKVVVDSENRSMRIPVHANAQFSAAVNREAILSDLIGSKKEKLQTFLDKHPELEKLDIVISPAGLTNSIPKFKSRVKFQIVE